MNTVAQIDHWIEVARSLNYEVRYDYFGGTGGGVCIVGGKKCLFIDLALSPIEQLELLRAAIGDDPLAPQQRAA
jgi:hypothetical protein